ncbi:MAG TPA: MFS transporter [Acidisoma sp.]|uniref:MFS transporter n=1 Tax=Acidisoma sp. TaxID=1872115 RepID=UPI002BE93153|nr:MFS transporter [Acidisoma sp.]HTI03333.1 MFS transporter [Acidisoma sp.]
MAINFADKGILGLAATPIMRDLRLTHTQLGAVGLGFFSFFSISSIVFGLFIRKLSTKWTLLGMVVAWSLCQCLVLVWTSSTGLLVSRVLLGLADGGAYPVALYAAYKWFQDDRRALPTSVIAIGGAVGSGLLAPVLAFLITQLSWRETFGILSAAGLFWCGAWMIFGLEGPGKEVGSSKPQPGAQKIPVYLLLTSRTVLGAQLSGFCAYWLLTLAVLWLPAYLSERFGFSLHAVANIVVLLTLCQITVAPAICGLSQHLVRNGVSTRYARGFVAGLSVMAAGSMTILFPRLSGALFPIGCLLAAFSVGAVILVLGQVIVAQVAPPSQRGLVMGVTNAVMTFAGPLASLSMGFIADRQWGGMRGFDAGFTLVGAMVLVGGFLGILLMNPALDRHRLGPST